jgi:hypothetical protein
MLRTEEWGKYKISVINGHHVLSAPIGKKTIPAEPGLRDLGHGVYYQLC